jgi:ABC-type Fe3+-siderophore transport system permease subunit
MKKRTTLILIFAILLCLSGMLTGIVGFVELIEPNYVIKEDVTRIPLAIAMLLSGMFAFVVVFTYGMDHDNWERLNRD